jgi:hypothetical protein
MRYISRAFSENELSGIGLRMKTDSVVATANPANL